VVSRVSRIMPTSVAHQVEKVEIVAVRTPCPVNVNLCIYLSNTFIFF
jgi:hypothetical protein